jgi:hypothetical protein
MLSKDVRDRVVAERCKNHIIDPILVSSEGPLDIDGALNDFSRVLPSVMVHVALVIAGQLLPNAHAPRFTCQSLQKEVGLLCMDNHALTPLAKYHWSSGS